ncbi:hypothetical protein DID78_03910, partial [Candidatus Marinamargulisbacteria bacterium SCGC AG-343-D04]
MFGFRQGNTFDPEQLANKGSQFDICRVDHDGTIPGKTVEATLLVLLKTPKKITSTQLKELKTQYSNGVSGKPYAQPFNEILGNAIREACQTSISGASGTHVQPAARLMIKVAGLGFPIDKYMLNGFSRNTGHQTVLIKEISRHQKNPEKKWEMINFLPSSAPEKSKVINEVVGETLAKQAVFIKKVADVKGQAMMIKGIYTTYIPPEESGSDIMLGRVESDVKKQAKLIKAVAGKSVEKQAELIKAVAGRRAEKQAELIKEVAGSEFKGSKFGQAITLIQYLTSSDTDQNAIIEQLFGTTVQSVGDRPLGSYRLAGKERVCLSRISGKLFLKIKDSNDDFTHEEVTSSTNLGNKVFFDTLTPTPTPAPTPSPSPSPSPSPTPSPTVRVDTFTPSFNGLTPRVKENFLAHVSRFKPVDRHNPYQGFARGGMTDFAQKFITSPRSSMLQAEKTKMGEALNGDLDKLSVQQPIILEYGCKGHSTKLVFTMDQKGNVKVRHVNVGGGLDHSEKILGKQSHLNPVEYTIKKKEWKKGKKEFETFKPNMKYSQEGVKSKFSSVVESFQNMREANIALRKILRKVDATESPNPKKFALAIQTQGYCSWESLYTAMQVAYEDIVEVDDGGGAEGTVLARTAISTMEMELMEAAMNSVNHKTEAIFKQHVQDEMSRQQEEYHSPGLADLTLVTPPPLPFSKDLKDFFKITSNKFTGGLSLEPQKGKDVSEFDDKLKQVLLSGHTQPVSLFHSFTQGFEVKIDSEQRYYTEINRRSGVKEKLYLADLEGSPPYMTAEAKITQPSRRGGRVSPSGAEHTASKLASMGFDEKVARLKTLEPVQAAEVIKYLPTSFDSEFSDRAALINAITEGDIEKEVIFVKELYGRLDDFLGGEMTQALHPGDVHKRNVIRKELDLPPEDVKPGFQGLTWKGQLEVLIDAQKRYRGEIETEGMDYCKQDLEQITGLKVVTKEDLGEPIVRLHEDDRYLYIDEYGSIVFLKQNDDGKKQINPTALSLSIPEKKLASVILREQLKSLRDTEDGWKKAVELIKTYTDPEDKISIIKELFDINFILVEFDRRPEFVARIIHGSFTSGETVTVYGKEINARTECVDRLFVFGDSILWGFDETKSSIKAEIERIERLKLVEDIKTKCITGDGTLKLGKAVTLVQSSSGSLGGNPADNLKEFLSAITGRIVETFNPADLANVEFSTASGNISKRTDADVFLTLTSGGEPKIFRDGQRYDIVADETISLSTLKTPLRKKSFETTLQTLLSNSVNEQLTEEEQYWDYQAAEDLIEVAGHAVQDIDLGTFRSSNFDTPLMTKLTDPKTRFFYKDTESGKLGTVSTRTLMTGNIECFRTSPKIDLDIIVSFTDLKTSTGASKLFEVSAQKVRFTEEDDYNVESHTVTKTDGTEST